MRWRAWTPRSPCACPSSSGVDAREGEELESTDPGNPERVVAVAAKAGEDDVETAVRQAEEGFRRWSATSAEERAGALVRAAGWMRERRLELAALEVRECAKPWLEADADVCEAIDFLEYYAREAIELARGPELVQVPGERNELTYAPRGVAAVIAPWNFPIAIPCGMTAAALVTGNAAMLEAGRAVAGVRSPGRAGAARGGRARGCARAAAGRGRGGRRPGPPPGRGHDRVHGLASGGPRDRARGRRHAHPARSTSSASSPSSGARTA